MSWIGLSTYRWRNGIKSAFMLALFPLLLIALLWCFFILTGHLKLDRSTPFMLPETAQFYGYYIKTAGITPFDFALERTIALAPLVLILFCVWSVVITFIRQKWAFLGVSTKPLDRQAEPRAYNLLENLCISRGLEMPQLRIIERPSLNCLTTGFPSLGCTMIVTRGLLDQLTDEELEAVFAHEIGHIVNGDTFLLELSSVFCGMLLFLPVTVWRTLFMLASSNEEDEQTQTIMIGLFIIGLILFSSATIVLVGGYVFATLLQLGLLSRRDFNADAFAVALTKNPAALFQALKKIQPKAGLAFLPAEQRLALIENTSSVLGFFNTHPPLDRRLDVLYAMMNHASPDAQEAT